MNLKHYSSFLQFMLSFVFLMFMLLIEFNEINAQNRVDSLLQQIENTTGNVQVGLVLAGGGAKGLAHIGVIKVLEEEGITVNYVGGTSIGGLVGGLYALGNNATDLNEIAIKLDWDKLLSDQISRLDLSMNEKSDLSSYLITLPLIGFTPNLPKGLLKGQLIQNEITKLTWKSAQVKDFSTLPIPFFCIATDIETGEEVVLDRGNLAEALRATMSIPSVFEPIVLGNRMLVDGGLVNNFPVDIMKSKGINFVIGVDVGASLYKKDEINSILQILDQSASFYGRKKADQNIEMADLYIKPDITGLNTMDFEDVQEIINRGEQAARLHIEEIRALARYLKNKNKEIAETRMNFQNDSIYISEIKFNATNFESLKIIKSRFKMKPSDLVTITQINEAVNRVYFSGFFETISYEILTTSQGNILIVNVQEKTNNLFSLGAQFNEYTKASILLNIRLHNFGIKGTKTNLSFILGQNPGIRLKYLTDKGGNFGWGFLAGYYSRELIQYNKNYSAINSTFFNSFTNTDLILFTNYSSFRQVIIGVQFDYYSIESKVNYVPSLSQNSPNFNFYARYEIDYWDHNHYPNSGLKATGIITQTTKYNSHPMTQISADINLAFSTKRKKIFFQPSIFMAASFGNKMAYPYYYIIGGQNISLFNRMIDFVGMNYTAQFTTNILMAKLKTRWNIKGRHNIFAIANAATFNHDFIKLVFDSKLYYGGGAGYSLNSPIGPIEFSITASNLGTKTLGVLNIGYWF